MDKNKTSMDKNIFSCFYLLMFYFYLLIFLFFCTVSQSVWKTVPSEARVTRDVVSGLQT